MLYSYNCNCFARQMNDNTSQDNWDCELNLITNEEITEKAWKTTKN